VDRRVHLHQLAETLPAGPTTAVGVAAPPALPQPRGQQPAPQRLRADGQALLGQLLAGEGGAEVGELPAIGGQDGLAPGGVEPAVGGPAAQAVDQGGVAVGLEEALGRRTWRTL
jgi:hypothetical protein